MVPVAESVELWELRAFMVPINRPLCSGGYDVQTLQLEDESLDLEGEDGIEAH